MELRMIVGRTEYTVTQLESRKYEDVMNEVRAHLLVMIDREIKYGT